VADCLEKALESVPEDKRKANAELQTMYEGVQLIETVFLKVCT
jgi:molecular chaperone GrpE (heat shock protein)